MANKAINSAIRHFDSTYAKYFGFQWPSARIGLLSPKKYCLIANSFVAQPKETEGSLDLSSYYKRHLRRYSKGQQESVTNQDPAKTKPQADSEITSDGGLSSAEDLIHMFSDRRVDENDKFFINRASTMLSLNDFVPATELITKEDLHGVSTYYDDATSLDLDIARLEEPPLEFSEQLRIFVFPRGSWSKFDAPETDQAELMSHYLMDGASILPVLALNVQLDDICADFCAAPGGKSLAMLMTLRPRHLLCNDSSSSRLGRMYSLMRQYLPDVTYVRDTLRLSNRDAANFIQKDAFDKILVDVPCSNDRHSVENEENSIFSRKRLNERLSLPEKQTSILTSALKSVRPGGSVVYSTCTMSPLENDNVVQKALMGLQVEGYNARFGIVSLKEAFRPLRGLFNFHTKLQYGQLVVPNLMNNFGPMYISKISRIS